MESMLISQTYTDPKFISTAEREDPVSNTDSSRADALVELRIKCDVSSLFGMIEIQRVGTLVWVESLPDEIGLRVFEGAC